MGLAALHPGQMDAAIPSLDLAAPASRETNCAGVVLIIDLLRRKQNEVGHQRRRRLAQPPA